VLRAIPWNAAEGVVAKVLIVDDDVVTVRLLSTLLEMDGFDVVTAGRGQDVLPRVHAELPDAIMIDFHLADMDGVEVIRQIRKDPKLHTLPIIMASGLDVQIEAISAGASLFLAKPFDPGELPRLFNKLIAG
jgi:CheY-like chemotaxis protein